MAINMVLAGDYEGKGLALIKNQVLIVLEFGFMKNVSVPLDRSTVESYELITDDHRKSAASGVARGLVGGALLGPVGLLAGGLSAKNKSSYTLAIKFKDNKSSLIEVDDKVYKGIVKNCF